MAATHTESFNYPVSVDPYGVKQEITFLPTQMPKVDGFITGWSVNIVDATDGTPLPIQRLMLHHIVFQKLGVQNNACKNFTSFDSKTLLPAFAENPYGAGEERNVMVLPPGYGYPISKNDNWSMVWMLMNHRAVTDNALIHWEVTVDDSALLKPVIPLWFDVRNCNADPVYSVGGSGKPKVAEEKAELTMPESGRIVAAGGHVHGGAADLVLSQPACNNRTIHTSKPAWGMPDHPFYNVRPILHEPGPVSMSRYTSEQGFPVQKGQKIRLTSRYDNTRPHTRVMGIVPAYLAPGEVSSPCEPAPTDAQDVQPAQLAGIPFRTKTPKFKVPLTGFDANGQAIKIDRPPGKTRSLASGSTIKLGDFNFSTANIKLKKGGKLNWRVDPSTLHNITLANGPRGFASPNLNDGRTFTYKFKTPGTYQIFCALHPVSMTQTVTVPK